MRGSSDAGLSDDVEARVDDPIAASGVVATLSGWCRCGGHGRTHIARTTRAGFPTAITSAGMCRVTIEPAPITLLSPMVTPGQTMTPPPSHTLSPMAMG